MILPLLDFDALLIGSYIKTKMCRAASDPRLLRAGSFLTCTIIFRLASDLDHTDGFPLAVRMSRNSRTGGSERLSPLRRP